MVIKWMVTVLNPNQAYDPLHDCTTAEFSTFHPKYKLPLTDFGVQQPLHVSTSQIPTKRCSSSFLSTSTKLDHFRVLVLDVKKST